MNTFFLNLTDGFIWNYDELLKFLIENQKTPIKIHTNSEGACLTSAGLYQLLDAFSFKSVNITTSNAIEAHDQYQIEIYLPYKFLKIPNNIDYAQFHMWNANKVFGVIYNRPSWARIGLAGYLGLNFENKTALNFRANPHDIDSRKFFDIQQLFEIDPVSANDFLKIIDKFPCQFETVDGYTTGASTQEHTDQLTKFYKDFLIDIVVETFVTGQTFSPTEKTVRPMLLKKPFIIFGPRNYLYYLHQLGFKTFHTPTMDFWSEDYDGYDGQERYIKILLLIDELAKKSREELQELYQAMQPILDHNYNLLQTQSYNTTIAQIT